MNWYHFKRLVLTPYIWYMRYKTRHKTGFIKSALELHYYRPAYYRFIRATILNRDIMYEVPLKEGDIALDVGAYIGDWAARVHEKYKPRIDMFEPDPGSVQRLEERFADNPDVGCFPYGLGAKDSELSFVQRGMGSTFYADEAAPGHKVMTLPIRDVAGVLDELGYREIDVMKLNIEGGEYDVLERLIEVGRIPSIRCFLIQFHEWLDGAHKRRRRIQKALRQTHTPEWDYPFVWEKWVRRDS